MMVLKSSPIGTVTGAAGGILKGGAGMLGNVVGGIFGGGGTNTPSVTATNSAGATNAPATNAPPKNLLESLPNLFRK
jgi:hypothetical protein